MRILILSFLGLFLLSSCEESISFQQPQPTGKRNLKRIPKALHGTYAEVDGLGHISINTKGITSWHQFQFKTHRDSIDLALDSFEVVHQNGKFLVLKNDYNMLKVQWVKDSAVGTYSFSKLFFELSGEQILRKFKGHYFLNTKAQDSIWQVKILSIDGSKLRLSEFRNPKELDELKELTSVENIEVVERNTAAPLVNPSRKELKQLMTHNSTTHKEFIKIE